MKYSGWNQPFFGELINHWMANFTLYKMVSKFTTLNTISFCRIVGDETMVPRPLLHCDKTP